MTLRDAIAAASVNHDAVAPANAEVDRLTALRTAAVAAANSATTADTQSNDFLSSVLPDDGKLRTTPKLGQRVGLVDGKAKFFDDAGDGSDVTIPDAPGGPAGPAAGGTVAPPVDVPPATDPNAVVPVSLVNPPLDPSTVATS